MRFAATILAFWTICCAGAAAVTCAVFAIPDSRASPIVPMAFCVMTVLFGQSASALWRRRLVAVRRLRRTVLATPLLGFAIWSFAPPKQPSAYAVALTIGFVVYALAIHLLARRVGRAFSVDSPTN